MVGEERVPLGLCTIFLRGTGFCSLNFVFVLCLGLFHLMKHRVISSRWFSQFSVESGSLCFCTSGWRPTLHFPFHFSSPPRPFPQYYVGVKRNKKDTILLVFLANLGSIEGHSQDFFILWEQDKSHLLSFVF